MKFVSPLVPVSFATLPSASANPGAVVAKTGTDAGLYYSDGTDWFMMTLQADPAGTAAAMAIALG